MKKISGCLVLFLALPLFAADYNYPGVTPRDTHGSVVGASAQSQSIYAVSVSSYGTIGATTPTVIAANTSRKSISFDNQGAKSVMFNTYSMTSSSSSYSIATVTRLEDTSGYTGAYYLVAADGEAAQTVIIRDISK